MYVAVAEKGDRLRLTRAPVWPRSYIVPILALVLAVYFALREVEDQGPFTRAAAVLTVLATGLSFIEDTQMCDIYRGASPRVEICRGGMFDWLLGTDGVRVFPGKVVSVTVATERLRYFADGFQVQLEVDDCPIEVMVTGSCTLDPQAEHIAVAHSICRFVGLDSATDIVIDETVAAITKKLREKNKPHSS